MRRLIHRIGKAFRHPSLVPPYLRRQCGRLLHALGDRDWAPYPGNVKLYINNRIRGRGVHGLAMEGLEQLGAYRTKAKPVRIGAGFCINDLNCHCLADFAASLLGPGFPLPGSITVKTGCNLTLPDINSSIPARA